MTTSNPRLLAVGAALALGLLGAPARADHVSCTAIELSMTKGKDPVIPDAVKHFAKKLGKPPYSSWNVFKVLSSEDFTLDSLKSKSLKLAAGSSTVVLHDVDVHPGKKTRITLAVTMDGQSGKHFESKVTADAGDPLDYGEVLSNNDGHFVFLSCNP
jgi:hypothetical protein